MPKRVVDTELRSATKMEAAQTTAEGRFRCRAWPARPGVQTGPPDYEMDSFGVLLDHVEEALDIDLFKEESWRGELWNHIAVEGSADTWEADEQADEMFESLEEDMRENDMWGLSRDGCEAQRLLVNWLMEQRLDGIEALLDEGLLHVGEGLFPSWTQEWQHDEGGESESLLGIAARNLCSPSAVRLLLARGADPNGELVHLSFNGSYHPTHGPAALANRDMFDYWGGSVADKIGVFTALAEAGGDACGASCEYFAYVHTPADKFAPQIEAVDALMMQQCARVRRDFRSRLETVTALNGIISFWRRTAAAPGSKAATAAIARLAKRAKCEE